MKDESVMIAPLVFFHPSSFRLHPCSSLLALKPFPGGLRNDSVILSFGPDGRIC